MELLRPEATVLSLGRRVLSFDREGRPYHYFREGKTYKRALAGSLHLRYREGERRRRRLAPEEALGVYQEVLDLAEAHLRDERRREEVLRWTPEGLLDPTPYRRAYAWPVSILPPDAYLSVVLQATTGCTWNRCAFCSFYQDRPFQKRTPEAFREHIQAVLALLGRGRLLRRGVFLADGNALALSEPLLPLLELVDSVEEADFVLVNTCAVRGKPVEKVRSLLGQLRKEKERRGLLIGMMGCLAQLDEGQQMAKKFGVDVLLGPGALTSLPEALKANERFFDLTFREDVLDYIPPPPKGALSAHVTIIRGCNHHCTYCIVPTTRGPEVSRHPDLILKEIELLKQAGVVEVTLLGQNVNSYGKDQPGFPSFAELLRMVGGMGIPRVRFLTSHPVNFTDDIIEAIAETPAICRYIHLPVQSGSDRVLRRMAREYRRAHYLERIRKIREALPDAVLSTDIIVGFPGETEEDFQETLSLYDEVGYDQAYMFICSPRPGTPAYKHFQDLPREVKVERLMRLIEKQKEWSYRRNLEWVGKTVEVLVRGEAKEEGFVQGHDRGNHPVLVPASQAPVPGLYQVEIKQATPHLLFGEVVGAEAPAPIPLPVA